MNRVPINPLVLKWARERAGLTREELATKKLTAEEIRNWESGAALPSEAQAEKIAEKLRIPYLVLFLSDLPDIGIDLPDLRNLSGLPPKETSLNFVETVNEALLKQDWFREFQRERGASRLRFAAAFTQADSPGRVAKNIRDTLRIDMAMRRQCSNWEQFLDRLIVSAENAGILVLRSGIVRHATNRRLSVDEFQGFVLSDPLAPLIFINDNDFTAAQIFTVAHELAHVWLGVSGIPDSKLSNRKSAVPNAVEEFCNSVAAEVLVPENELEVLWKPSRAPSENVRAISISHRVSSMVALRRAYETNKINYPQFISLLEAEYDRFREHERRRKEKRAQQEKKQDGNFWASFLLRNSPRFTDTIITAVKEGRALYTEAASLLGLKVAAFERYLQRVGAR